MDSNASRSQPTEGLHILVQKPSTESRTRPRSVCQQCCFEGISNKLTRTICSECKVGLCGPKCFQEFHLDMGFVLVPAARLPEVLFPEFPPVRVVSEPESEQGPSSSSEDTSDEPRRRGHSLVRKPPTPRKKYPQLRCRQCIFEGRSKRKDTRNMCRTCERGLCSRKCFDSYHERMGIEVRDSNTPGSTSSEHDTTSPTEDLAQNMEYELDRESARQGPENISPESNSPEDDLVQDLESASAVQQQTSPLPEQSELEPRVLRSSTRRQRPISPRPLDLRTSRRDLEMQDTPMDLRLSRRGQPGTSGQQMPPRKRHRSSESSDK